MSLAEGVVFVFDGVCQDPAEKPLSSHLKTDWQSRSGALMIHDKGDIT
jgi:hypothetical protein